MKYLKLNPLLMLILGADEAGKGPVIGSMFIAGLVIEEEKLFDLAAYGVKDSKKLSPAKREVWPRRSQDRHRYFHPGSTAAGHR